ncbi:MAG: hypothetical protein ACI9MC_003280 [Kiritimatiellia bacterium]|jgi:hypothetical protein
MAEGDRFGADPGWGRPPRGMAALCAHTSLVRQLVGAVGDRVPVGRAADSERAIHRAGPGWVAICGPEASESSVLDAHPTYPMVGSLAACTPSTSEELGPTDTDGTELPAPDCDFTAFEAAWSGAGKQDPHEFTLDYTYCAFANGGEVVGTGIAAITNIDPPVSCGVEIVRVPRPQNEWTVVVERGLADGDNCVGSAIWTFIRVEDDTLFYEAGQAEFGDRISFAELDRVDGRAPATVKVLTGLRLSARGPP